MEAYALQRRIVAARKAESIENVLLLCEHPHGLAYNVSTDLRYFDLIVACGIADRKATSLEKLLGRSVDLKEVEQSLAKHFGEVFGREMKEAAREELLEKLEHAERQAAVSA